VPILSVIAAFRLYKKLLFHYLELAETLRKKEIDLKEKELANHQWISILNALPANIALLDKKGVIIAVNNAWRSFAANESALTGNNYEIGDDYINIKNGKTLIATKLREMIDGKVKMLSIICPGQSPVVKKWFRIIATRENDNKNAGIVVMHLDVTEQQEAEEKIRQSAANLRQIIDLVPHLIFVKELNGAFILANKRFAEFYGITSAELLNERMSKTTVNDQEQISIAEDVEVIVSGKIKVLPEMEIRDHAGNTHIFYTTKVPYTPVGTRVKAVLNVGIEMTAQKTVEKALQKSEANLRSIFNYTEIAFILLDKSFIILSCNEIANRWAGFAFGTVMLEGANLPSLVSEDRRQETIDLLCWVLEGNSIDEDANYRLIDGTVEWYRVRMNPVHDNERVIIGICLSATNITAQKLAELESIKLTRDLDQRNRVLEQFAYTISHNLRSPLANIIGISDVLLNMEPTRVEEEQLKNNLSISVIKLDAVIKDLCYVLQVKREISEKIEKVSFSELVGDIELSIESLIRKERVIITCNFPEVKEMVTLKSYIYSIFFNLISNSIKYSQPNVSPVIEIKSTKTPGKIALSFKDNGLGIDLEKNGKHLFGLYKRFHNHKEGKGLGLYMIKTQVEMLGGKISINSEVNKGTEFIIEFDIKKG
jgi:PAS domain S-box-containing protein